MPLTIDAAMQLNWTPVITADEDEPSCLALHVPPVADFVLYGESREQLLGEWREALESHLRGYLAVGKKIPRPIVVSVSRDLLDGVETRSAASTWVAAHIANGILLDVEQSPEPSLN